MADKQYHEAIITFIGTESLPRGGGRYATTRVVRVEFKGTTDDFLRVLNIAHPDFIEVETELTLTASQPTRNLTADEVAYRNEKPLG